MDEELFEALSAFKEKGKLSYGQLARALHTWGIPAINIMAELRKERFVYQTPKPEGIIAWD